MTLPPDTLPIIIVMMIGLLFIAAQVLRQRFEIFLKPEIRKVVQMDLKKLKETPREW